MNNVFVMTCLGLGDAIIQNGLVRELAKTHEKVYFPCYLSNSPSVSFMFSDLPNVIIQDIYSPSDIFTLQMHHKENGNDVMALGMYSGEHKHPEGETFDQTFYRQADVNFQKRWDSFKIPESTQTVTMTLKPTAFICDSKERGYEIDDGRINPLLVKFRPWNSHTIFDFIPIISSWSTEGSEKDSAWMKVIESITEEIHTIDSSWLHLIESIPTKAKLFYHLYARNGGAYNQAQKRKDWTILT